MTRIERLHAIATYLQHQRGGATADALALHFGVSVRTMYRDLDALRDAHLPVQAEAGPGGGYALDRSRAIAPVHLDVREAIALYAAAAWIERGRLLPFRSTLRAASDKVRDALPHAHRAHAERIIDELAFAAPTAPAGDEATRSIVERAWQQRRPIAFRYEGTRGPSHRRARVHSILVDAASVSVNATDLDRNVPRRFDLDRMHDVRFIELSRRPH
jgi:predicted DNA-binding transcriptional regulator YafY